MVHPVGDGRAVLRLGEQVEVPGLPRGAPAREQARRRCAAPPRWPGRGSRRGSASRRGSGRRAAPAPGRCGTRGPPRRSARSRPPRTVSATCVGVTRDRPDRRAQPQTPAQRARDRVDVGPRAARDRQPLRAVAQRRASRGCGRTPPGSARGRSTSAPGRPTTRRRPAARSGARRTAREYPPSRRNAPSVGPASSRSSSRARSRLKRSEVDDHPVECRAHQVARLAVEPARRARVLEVLAVRAHAEAHVGGLRSRRRARRAARGSAGRCGRCRR